MKKILAVALTAMLALSAAACGKSEAPASSAAPAASSAEQASGTPNIDRIKQAGELVMVTNATFPPFEYIGADGQPTGVDVEVAQAIADELGVELKVQDMNFDLLIDSVKAGKGDFAAAGMTIKPERLEQVDFSIEYVKSAQHVVIPKDSNITVDSLDNLVIAVQESTTGDFFATDEIAAKEVLRFKSAVDAGAALKAGKCDAVIVDKLPAETIAAGSDGALVVLPDALTEESYAIAVKKDSPDLLEAINKVLQKLVDEGKIDEMVSKHMLEA